jgi:hypothetical protein
MCRWLAYVGSPARIDDLIYKPEHSLIDQSLHAQMGAETTNGEGFGIGWYGSGARPAVLRSIEPAWNDRNLHELAQQIESPLVFAHIRASSGNRLGRPHAANRCDHTRRMCLGVSLLERARFPFPLLLDRRADSARAASGAGSASERF